MGSFLAWVLIVILGGAVIYNAVGLVQTVIARRKARAVEDKNKAGEEVKKDENTIHNSV